MAKIVLKGATNVREFGGIENSVGREILYKKFMRGSELSRLTKEDIDLLRQKYNLGKIIDLRNSTEILEKPNQIIPGCEEVNIPLLKASIPGFTGEKDAKLEKGKTIDPVEIYCSMINDFAIAQIKKIFDIVMNSTCSIMWISNNGRDRAEIISYLFLKILDVSDEEIIKDYLFSNECLKQGKGLLGGIFGKKQGDPCDAKEESLQAAIDVLNEKYGSVNAFIEKELGFTKEKKLAFQKKHLIY
ncbi:MAG: tyrosine-protein phosphatase [Bacilli bacterium]